MASLINLQPKLGTIIVLLIILTTHAVAQSNPPITNEYRLTQIYTKPINEKWVLFAYTGYTKSPEKDYTSLYASPPNIIYIAKPWLEFYGAFITVYTKNKNASHTWEFRPVAAVKVYLPNEKKWFIYSWTRYENRLILQNDNLQSIP